MAEGCAEAVPRKVMFKLAILVGAMDTSMHQRLSAISVGGR